MKKEIKLKTKRMLLMPMGVEELEERIRKSDEELRQAYSEMLHGAVEHPWEELWYLPWKMVGKSDGAFLGDLCFKGGPVKGAVEIGYGMQPEYEGKGLMTEAVKALTEWAFMQENVYIVEAETEAENRASQKVLEKNSFKPTGQQGKEGPRFAKEKPKTSWGAVYMLFGMSIGMSLGSISGQTSIGMLLGIGGGFAIGTSLDNLEKQRREKVLKS